MNWKNSVIYILLAVVLTAGSICLIALYRELHMYKAAKDTYMVFQAGGTDEIGETAAATMRSNQYPGMVGMIRSKDNLICYPIMQGEDNEYYLTHMADGEVNACGSIFLDSNAEPDFSSAVSVVYGHHVKNGMMFGALDRYKEKAYYEAYPAMELYIGGKTAEIEIIAAFLADGSSAAYPASNADKDEIRTFLHTMEATSFYVNKPVDFENKNIIILSTCSYEYENARLAVVGVINKQ